MKRSNIIAKFTKRDDDLSRTCAKVSMYIYSKPLILSDSSNFFSTNISLFNKSVGE